MQGILLYFFDLFVWSVVGYLGSQVWIAVYYCLSERTYIIMLLCVHVSWKWKSILAKVLNCLHDILLMLEQTGHF